MDSKISTATRLIRCGGAVSLLAILALACTDDSPMGPGQPLGASPFVLSGPLSAPSVVATHAFLGPPSGSTVTYVSLPPGSIPNGSTATIAVVRTGYTVVVNLVAGGFDPVAVPAEEGDSITITVQSPAAGPKTYTRTVPATADPIVVRTDPPAHKRDVPLNAVIVIVFSEPIDPATLNSGSVQLWLGATQAPGAVQLSDADGIRAEFRPDTLLAGSADYQLVVTQAIANVEGVALDSAVAVSFTTGSTIPIDSLVFASIAALGEHTCGVTPSGAAYCWGDNTFGQLGDGTTASSATPVAVAGGLTFKAISVSSEYTCGLTTDGAAYCWGANYMGQLGLGTRDSGEPNPFPIAVPGGLTFAMLSSGGDHSCGVSTAGSAYCWGSDIPAGVIGDGTSPGTSGTNDRTPTLVAGGHTFAAVSAGPYHTCGVTTSGAAYCWGWGMGGRLGNGETGYGDHLLPVAVSGGFTFRAITAGEAGTCGVTGAGSAYCWGRGPLGTGTTAGLQQCAFVDDNLQPITLPCSTVPLQVAGGHTFAGLSVEYDVCGVTTIGAAYCWGINNVGQLGNGTTTGSSTPVVVAGGLDFRSVNTGANYVCGVTTGGVAYCWGDNSHGQLGDGTATNSTVPVKVAGQP